MICAEWSESHRSKALHAQRSSGSFSQAQSIHECQTDSVSATKHRRNRWILSNKLFCPGWSAKRGGLGLLHAIADSERCLGAWYGVIFVLLVIVRFNDWTCLFKPCFGRFNQHFENLTQGCACQTSMFFWLYSSALGKTRHVRSGNSQLQLELLGPTVHLPGELRAQPWHRLRSVWNMGLLVENWAAEHLHVMAIWCLHWFLTAFFNHQI